MNRNDRMKRFKLISREYAKNAKKSKKLEK